MTKSKRRISLGIATAIGVLLLAVLLLVLRQPLVDVHADPIPPEQGGYPKFTLSTKTVTPTLAFPGETTLTYTIQIVNSGAYTAEGTTVIDVLPEGTMYAGYFDSSVSGALTVEGGVLTWIGDVGFDATTVLTFSVTTSPALTGVVRNAAVISHPLASQPFTVTAETVLADTPILVIEKSSAPAMPGANKPLTYTLTVINIGQPANDLPITVTDRLPLNTTLLDPGGGVFDGTTIAWTRPVTLGVGGQTVFTFSVDVGDVLSGTVIANDDYQVFSAHGIDVGEPYTVTVVDPILLISKQIWPDPPGSNREMTYTLTVLNRGSLATGLVVTDRVPSGVIYQSGGTESGGVVSWALPSLDTGESANLTFTVLITDVMNVAIGNTEYGACCAEGVCSSGWPVTSVVEGPHFETFVELDPIAKGPGAGTKPVTPTLVVHNLGPGNALSATALIYFYNINISGNDFYATPPVGVIDGPFTCAEDECTYFTWVGDLFYGDAITFTTHEGQNTTGGEEGTLYTATVVITDSLGAMTTEPVTGTAVGRITHLANLRPSKSAPPVVGEGRLLTYTIRVWNSGLSTEEPPLPSLVDVVPPSTTVVHISDGGVSQTISNTTVVSWTLPPMSTGDELVRTFAVRVDDDLVSGTQIVNSDYTTYWMNRGAIYSNTGQIVTTTVQEVGLIHSYKTVTPTISLPGPGVAVTYFVNIVNSSAVPLTDVVVYDLLPWQHSTYLRDAVASAGSVVSDIVSVRWTGNVGALSSEVVTLTVVADPWYEGPLTNTAVISHPELLSEVVVQAVAYITDEPLLFISKSASPDPVERGAELTYAIHVVNSGQQATNVIITDVLPVDTTYVPGSATAGGQRVGNQVQWMVPVLLPGEARVIQFRVLVGNAQEVINDRYGVRSAERGLVLGAPVITPVKKGAIYLPLVMRNAR